MNTAFELKRVGRSLGIVAVFSILGPIAVAAFFMLVVLVVGIPLLQLMLTMVDLEALRPWLSIAAFLLIVFSLAAAVPPAAITGIAFAVTSVYFRRNAVWVAVLIAALVSLGIVVMGFFVPSADSTTLLVPSVRGAGQALALSVFLAVPAIVAASLCWLVTRRLHRASP